MRLVFLLLLGISLTNLNAACIVIPGANSFTVSLYPDSSCAGTPTNYQVLDGVCVALNGRSFKSDCASGSFTSYSDSACVNAFLPYCQFTCLTLNSTTTAQMVCEVVKWKSHRQVFITFPWQSKPIDSNNLAFLSLHIDIRGINLVEETWKIKTLTILKIWILNEILSF